MPVHLDCSSLDHDHRASPGWFTQSGRSLHIGLVNNMPETAFKATQRQFVSLLDAASGDIQIRLSLYTLPGLSKGESGIYSGYSNVDALFDTRLDGLIVTGREPTTPNLRDEPYWESFTQVLEWAQQNTSSTIWSCLAAHAAVLHMDGISRRKRSEKLSGVFECVAAPDHWLTKGVPLRFQMPHSRWNGVSEADLSARGYEVLARTGDTEVDTFIKQGSSLFLFFQGHPEYESDTLYREYRRDVERYLHHQLNEYPSMPANYFDRNTEDASNDVRKQALSSRSKDLLTDLTTVLQTKCIMNTWHSTATSMYRNWLEFISARKNASECDAQVAAPYTMSR
jgi:homoserine O-succinyltransferase/O-acetyltransferase